MGIIEAAKLVFEYKKYDENGQVEEVKKAVDGVDLNIQKGQFIAILGHNGSGKSTLAKHINAILVPTEGTLYVDGKDTQKEENVWDIRSSAGMVFQNPDNQIIGSVVEEDVGFGPENMGVPTEEIWQRAEESLRCCGMWEYRKASPNKLSGGQKQRVAIAGVVAMHPKCIVLDEPTAMLDPAGRREVLRTVRALNQVENVTVILITHYMEEVIYADQVIVMDEGKIVMQGTPKEIFSQVDQLKQYRLDVPQVTLLAHELRKAGLDLPRGDLKPGRIGEKLMSIKIQELTHIYGEGTAFEKAALRPHQPGNSGWSVPWDYRAYRFWKIHADPAFKRPVKRNFRNHLLQWRRYLPGRIRSARLAGKSRTGLSVSGVPAL